MLLINLKMASLNNRGSHNANDWGMRRREQIERAKIMRDERKNGPISTSSNALQGAGSEFVHR